MTYLNNLIKKYFNSNNDIIDEKSFIKKKNQKIIKAFTIIKNILCCLILKYKK